MPGWAALTPLHCHPITWDQNGPANVFLISPTQEQKSISIPNTCRGTGLCPQKRFYFLGNPAFLQGWVFWIKFHITCEVISHLLRVQVYLLSPIPGCCVAPGPQGRLAGPGPAKGSQWALGTQEAPAWGSHDGSARELVWPKASGLTPELPTGPGPDTAHLLIEQINTH